MHALVLDHILVSEGSELRDPPKEATILDLRYLLSIVYLAENWVRGRVISTHCEGNRQKFAECIFEAAQRVERETRRQRLRRVRRLDINVNSSDDAE